MLNDTNTSVDREHLIHTRDLKAARKAKANQRYLDSSEGRSTCDTPCTIKAILGLLCLAGLAVGGYLAYHELAKPKTDPVDPDYNEGFEA